MSAAAHVATSSPVDPIDQGFELVDLHGAASPAAFVVAAVVVHRETCTREAFLARCGGVRTLIETFPPREQH